MRSSYSASQSRVQNFKKTLLTDHKDSSFTLLAETLPERWRNSQYFHLGVEVTVGPGPNSVDSMTGDGDGVGEGVGISSGVSTVPLFVCNTPPESITSSTR